jgi:hypothetical protein
MRSGPGAYCAARLAEDLCGAVPRDRGELEQIQFLPGHASVQTTERYLGCKQNLGYQVNDVANIAGCLICKSRTTAHLIFFSRTISRSGKCKTDLITLPD